MSHLRDQIAKLRGDLAALEALQAAEDAEADRATRERPAGLPVGWIPFIFRTNGTFAIVAWHDPNFTVTALRRVDRPTPPTPPGGPQP